MTTLYEKIAMLPPSLLPKVEHFVDSLTIAEDDWDDWDSLDDLDDDDVDWEGPVYDENGKLVHPKAGCLKGLIVMHDNFFEPDDDWEEYM